MQKGIGKAPAGEAKKSFKMGIGSPAGKPITAIICWETHGAFKMNGGTHARGHVIKLYADGSVWECMAFQDRSGTISYTAGKKKMRLGVLKAEWGNDLIGLARTWRMMEHNKHPEYEMVSPMVLKGMN